VAQTCFFSISSSSISSRTEETVLKRFTRIESWDPPALCQWGDARCEGSATVGLFRCRFEVPQHYCDRIDLCHSRLTRTAHKTESPNALGCFEPLGGMIVWVRPVCERLTWIVGYIAVRLCEKIGPFCTKIRSSSDRACERALLAVGLRA
jgi:hypothetical protein